MKVKLLLIENLEEDIKKDINSYLPTQEELERRKLDRLLGKSDYEEGWEQISINIHKYHKEVDFYFKLENISGVFLSTIEWKNNKIMIILLDGLEYNCIYDEEAYKTIINFLEL